jgi:hypothetical protein
MSDDDSGQLPVEQPQHGGDGFDDDGIGGIGPIEKFVDGDWSIGGVPSDPKRRLVAISTQSYIRRWRDKRIVETITEKPLPDLATLNAAVPASEWEIGLNGAPRPPYELAHRVDLLNLDSGEHTTFVAATYGAARAVSQLKTKVVLMRRMRGAMVVPQVVLGWAPFTTQFGMKKRPDFKVEGWFDFGGGQAAVPAQAPKALPPVAPTPVKEPSTEEEFGDQIPF